MQPVDNFDWMYKNQLGRRNLTDAQRTYLIGKLYEARKTSIGRPQVEDTDGKFRQNGGIKNYGTSGAIAKELGTGVRTVERAYIFSKGIDAIRESAPCRHIPLITHSNESANKRTDHQRGVNPSGLPHYCQNQTPPHSIKMPLFSPIPHRRSLTHPDHTTPL